MPEFVNTFYITFLWSSWRLTNITESSCRNLSTKKQSTNLCALREYYAEVCDYSPYEIDIPFDILDTEALQARIARGNIHHSAPALPSAWGITKTR